MQIKSEFPLCLERNLLCILVLLSYFIKLVGKKSVYEKDKPRAAFELYLRMLVCCILLTYIEPYFFVQTFCNTIGKTIRCLLRVTGTVNPRYLDFCYLE